MASYGYSRTRASLPQSPAYPMIGISGLVPFKAHKDRRDFKDPKAIRDQREIRGRKGFKDRRGLKDLKACKARWGILAR